MTFLLSGLSSLPPTVWGAERRRWEMSDLVSGWCRTTPIIQRTLERGPRPSYQTLRWGQQSVRQSVVPTSCSPGLPSDGEELYSVRRRAAVPGWPGPHQTAQESQVERRDPAGLPAPAWLGPPGGSGQLGGGGGGPDHHCGGLGLLLLQTGHQRVLQTISTDRHSETTISWGQPAEGGWCDLMIWSQVLLWDNSDCSRELRTKVTTSQVCAGGEFGQSACNGDSGGGLYIRRENDELAPWYLFGIVSFGVPNCQIAKPEVYVR